MYYPTRWDPFFTGYMTLADLFRYPTQHYDFHRRQLTLNACTWHNWLIGAPAKRSLIAYDH